MDIKTLSYSFILFLSAGFLTHAQAAPEPQNREPLIVAYYANWTSAEFSRLPVQNIDVLNYAFATASSDGTLTLSNPTSDNTHFQEIPKLLINNPNLKVVLSIGGWTGSSHFSDLASNPTRRANFANNVKRLMLTYPGLSGVDIDWEFPVAGGDNITHRSDDRANYVALVRDLRTALDSIDPNKHYLISIAGPSHSLRPDGGSVDNLDVKAMLDVIDWINIMDYDIHQSTSEPNQTNNDAALFQMPDNPASTRGNDSVDDSIQDYMKQGLTETNKAQLVMGIPLYGYAWRGVSADMTAAHPGLYRPAAGALPNAYQPGSDGIFTYNTIMNHLIPDQSMVASFDPDFKFSTYYSASTQSFLSFDDIDTVKAKSDYILSQGLGGAMFWEMSQDTSDENSLVYQTCLALTPNNQRCAAPQPSAVKTKLQLTNNDPNHPITLSLVTEQGAYYPFPSLTPAPNTTSDVLYTDLNSSIVATLQNQNNLRVLLTPTTGKPVCCNGNLDLSKGNGYHHIQVYYDYPTPNCLIN